MSKDNYKVHEVYCEFMNSKSIGFYFSRYQMQYYVDNNLIGIRSNLIENSLKITGVEIFCTEKYHSLAEDYRRYLEQAKKNDVIINLHNKSNALSERNFVWIKITGIAIVVTAILTLLSIIINNL